MFTGFSSELAVLSGASIHVRYGGNGPPILLLHGHPRTHATWYRVAERLVGEHTVVCPDLRGYGRSSKPEPRVDHSQQSKRAMAQDMLELMAHLGHPSFHAVGHDRGAYVAFRLAMDHPDAVTHLTVMDAVPMLDAIERCDSRFAASWWHWFFFAQPEKPERAINADPNAWYGDSPRKRAQMGQAWNDYQAAINDPRTVRCMLEDYRAGLGVDCQHDREDREAGRRLACPTTVLWALRDDLGDLYGDPLEVWRPWAPHLSGKGIDCGHHIAEEAPDDLALLLSEASRSI